MKSALDGEVHHQVPERIRRALLRQVVLALMALRVFKYGMIFGMFGDELRGKSSSGVSSSPVRRLRHDSNKNLRASSRDGSKNIKAPYLRIRTGR